MDSIIITPRLKLTLIERAERGQPELDWLHELYSNKETTLWSLSGQSQSLEDTEKTIRFYFSPPAEGDQKRYMVFYAVHRLLPSQDDGQSDTAVHITNRKQSSTEFVGFVNLVSVGPGGLVLPEHLSLPASAAATTLTVQLAYYLLPKGWGSGYATEATRAVLEACKNNAAFWNPYEKVYVRALVNSDNPASGRVMDKVGMERRGIFEWTGKAVFVGGRWRDKDSLVIYGKHLID